MLSGAAQVAFTDPASFYRALDWGERLVAIYNIYPQNVFNVVSPVDRGIKTPADLKGKTIGVIGSGGNIPMAKFAKIVGCKAKL